VNAKLTCPIVECVNQNRLSAPCKDGYGCSHDSDNRGVVILDLDNCIADDSRRISLIDWNEEHPARRYAAYHADAINDPFVEVGLLDCRVRSFVDVGVRIAIFTARPEFYRDITMRWLEKNGIAWTWLFMRPGDCDEPSTELKVQMFNKLIRECGVRRQLIKYALDDRLDVLERYRELGISTIRCAIHDDAVYEPTPVTSKTAADILMEMAETFRERNKVYGSNYKMVGPLVNALFPDGVPPELVVTDQWHLFELKLVKLSRFAISNLTHIDSIHDDAVYSAMIESILQEEK